MHACEILLSENVRANFVENQIRPRSSRESLPTLLFLHILHPDPDPQTPPTLSRSAEPPLPPHQQTTLRKT